jgi:hypothetical protein
VYFLKVFLHIGYPMAAHLTFKERDEFKQRLRSSLENAGLNPHSPTQIRTAFICNNEASQISLAAVYKWLEGESLPGSQNMKIMAKICGVCPDWLRTGLSTGDNNPQPQ